MRGGRENWQQLLFPLTPPRQLSSNLFPRQFSLPRHSSKQKKGGQLSVKDLGSFCESTGTAQGKIMNSSLSLADDLRILIEIDDVDPKVWPTNLTWEKESLLPRWMSHHVPPF